MARVQAINLNLETEMTADFEALWGVMPLEKRLDLARVAMEASALNQRYVERGDGIAGFRAADFKLSLARLRKEKKV